MFYVGSLKGLVREFDQYTEDPYQDSEVYYCLKAKGNFPTSFKDNHDVQGSEGQKGVSESQAAPQAGNLSEILKGSQTSPLPASKSLSAQLKEAKGVSFSWTLVSDSVNLMLFAILAPYSQIYLWSRL